MYSISTNHGIPLFLSQLKSLRTVKTRMIEMQKKGLIARKSGKRNGEWIIL